MEISKIFIILCLTLSLQYGVSQNMDFLDSVLDEVITSEGDTVINENIAVYEPFEVSEDPREFVIRYYDQIKKIPIEESYSLLTPRFKEKNGSFEDYKKHFNSFDGINVANISVLESTLDNRKVKVEASLDYVKQGKKYSEKYILTLIYDSDLNGWMFH